MQQIDKDKNCKKYPIVLIQSQKKIQKIQQKQVQATTNINNLRLKKGSSFWSLQDDFSSIYQNFNFISYMSPSCQAQILTRTTGDSFLYNRADLLTLPALGKMLMIEKSRSKFIGEFPTLEKPFEVIYNLVTSMSQKQGLEIQIDRKQIHSYILGLQNLIKQKKIRIITFVVKIYTVVEKLNEPDYVLCHLRNRNLIFQNSRQVIFINIIDNQDWISKQFNQFYDHRISQIRKSKAKQVQYFYLQPQDQRHKIINQQHINLALQGGGCKGVQYIGAYKAILKNKPKTKITSIIGSSAGSILGLAICLKLKPEQIQGLCIEKLSKVTNDKKFEHIDKNGQNFLQQTQDKVYDFIKKFNILQPQLLDTLMCCLKDEQVQSALLQLIQAATNPQIYKLFLDERKDQKQNVTKRLNLLGLLNGSLMKGNVIKDIAITCIKIFLQIIKKQNPQKIQKLLKKQKNRNKNMYEISEMITMKELYDITQIQLTCTAVDITNQILRFLNQKTTPNLPVCKAVQMSGSFPVAFQAQIWQASWGKYYIHYDNIRRQIDLAGCQLTDGGTLANFPVKYLDNQAMRPMYFSHAKTKNTVMYGIGLISDVPEDKEKQKKISQAVLNLAKKVISVIGICGPLSAWVLSKFTSCNCRQPKSELVQINSQNPFEAITSIPIIKFALKLLSTYSSTKDNLTEQCFSHSTYETPTQICYKNQIQNRLGPQIIAAKVNILKKNIQNSILKSQNQTKGHLFQVFSNNIIQLAKQQSLNLLDQMYLCDVTRILYQNISNFLYSLMSESNFNEVYLSILYKINVQHGVIDKTEKQSSVIKIIFQKINRIFKTKIFMLSFIKSDYQLLDKIVTSLIQFCQHINSESQIINQCLSKIRQKQQLEVLSIVDGLKLYCNSQKKDGGIKKSLKYAISKLSQLSITTNINQIRAAEKKVYLCQIPEIFIHDEAQKHRQSIIAYTYNRIMNYYNKNNQYDQKNMPTPCGLHLVMESVALSELYFHEYYLVVRDALLQYNTYVRKMNQRDNKKMKGKNQVNFRQLPFNKQLKVTTMTATSYHSLIIFLHASDLSEQRIGTEVWKIRDLIRMDKEKLNEKYKQSDWAKLTPILLRQIQKQAIEKKKDIFKYIEEDIIKNTQKYQDEFNKIKESIQNKIQNVRISNQQLINSIETSLSFILNTLLQIQGTGIAPDKIAQTLQDKLVLSWKQNQDSDLMRTKCSLKVKSVVQFFYQKYKDIVQYVFLSSPFVVDQVMKILKPDERKQVWKGIILSEFLSIDHIKSYVQKILVELKLNKNTTLKQFYDYSSKKIQINFSVVQDKFVAIYNYKTRPNMPVWAAIVAASSIPQFFPPLLDRPQWRQKEQKDYNKRNVASYFQKQQRPYIFITSSEALTRLPMDLLQNNKFIKQITDKNNQIFLVFNFGQFKFKSIFNQKQKIKEFNIQSLTMGQFISKFLSFKSLIYKPYQDKQKKRRILYEEQENLKALMMFFSLPMLQVKKNLLNLYIESHDNLIVRLYKRQLIQMPIRFSTLDFHLMTQKINQKQALSDICSDAIMQAQYIITEKISNRYISQDTDVEVKVCASRRQIDFISQKDLIQSEANNNLTKYSQNSKRLIYFRVQAVDIKNIKAQQCFKNNQFSQTKNSNLDELQLTNVSFNKVQPTCRKTNNILKIRILSMLNPSRQLYEKYQVYYPQKYQRKQVQKDQHNQQFVQIKKECILIDHNTYSRDNHLQLLIQYPSSDQTQIKTSYFLLKLDKLYQLNQQLIDKKKANKFGFVYSLQFDQLYSQNYLEAVGKWKQDYLNRDLEIIKSPTIGIMSNIQKTYHRSILCQKCVYQLQLQKVSAKSEQRIYECKKCMIRDKIINRFHVSYNTKKDIIQCEMGHEIIGGYNEIDEKYNFKFIGCYICGKGCIKEYWTDPECGIIFCDSCRRQSIEEYRKNC